jgi:excisionase family DNA binding protein
MSAVALKREPVLPSEKEASLALESSRTLARFLDDNDLDLEIVEDDKRAGLKLPPPAVRLLLDILTQMAEGHAVTLIPYHAELTTQQCADLLNVSRKHLVDEVLGKGLIPFRKVGTHRRIRFEDLMAFKKKDDAARQRALDELTALSEEMGLER